MHVYMFTYILYVPFFKHLELYLFIHTYTYAYVCMDKI